MIGSRLAERPALGGKLEIGWRERRGRLWVPAGTKRGLTIPSYELLRAPCNLHRITIRLRERRPARIGASRVALESLPISLSKDHSSLSCPHGETVNAPAEII